MSWLTGWTYRKTISLSHSGGALSAYAVKLLVGESSGAVGEDVDCAAHVATDFRDLRFTTADGVTLLDYFIESVTGTTPNQLATVWVECDSIGTGATTFCMYYGNAGASAATNGNATFLFFDDFEDGSIDGAKWTNSGSFSESGGYAWKQATNTNTNYLLVGKTNISHPCVIATVAKVGSDWLNEYSWQFTLLWDTAWATNGYLTGHFKDASNDYWKMFKFAGGSPSHQVNGSIAADTWYKLAMYINNTDQKVQKDGADLLAIASTPPAASNPLTLTTNRAAIGSDFTAYFNYCYARKWTTDGLEPAYGAFGGEETESAGGIVIPVLISQYRKRWTA